MSIAVAVKIRPSRWLRALFALLLAAVLALALWLVTGSGHALAAQPGRAGVAALALLLACALAWRQTRGLWQPCRLDVLASGQMFLTRTGGARQPVRMLPGSTLWPGCLFLRLQETGLADGPAQAGGAVHVVPVLPGSVSPGQLRALLVACRWLEARQGDAGPEKIL